MHYNSLYVIYLCFSKRTAYKKGVSTADFGLDFRKAGVHVKDMLEGNKNEDVSSYPLGSLKIELFRGLLYFRDLGGK